MARKMTEWPSKRGPITKIMPSDGCRAKFLPSVAGYDYYWLRTGGYLGNVGS